MTIMRITIVALCSLLILSSGVKADSIPVYLQKGSKGLLDKDFYKALENFTHVLRLDSKNFQALKNIGIAYEGINEHQLAREHFEMAYLIDSVDADLNNNLGAMYSNQKEPLKAIGYYEAAIRYDSTRPMYFVHLGQEYSRIGEIGKALPLLHRARQLNPGNPVTSFSIANCHAEAGALDSAEVYYQKSEEQGGNNWELFYFLGSVRMKLAKYQEAAGNFADAIAKKPDCMNCRQSQALSYFKTGNYDEAAIGFKAVVEADSANIGAWIGLGASYSLGGSIKSADSILFGLYVVDSSLGFEMLRVISTEYKRQKDTTR